jgi:3-deoxy-manno-octulosonate cytidylyltransferase (CMP-KDO synthetase)
MRFLGIIPAQYNSSRFPGKPLADIDGKPLIQRVFDQVNTSEFLDEVIVATDHDAIYAACQQLNIPVEMTESFHKSGLERIAEVAGRHPEFDAVIYIHCDEPFIMSVQIDLLAKGIMYSERTDISTLAKAIREDEDLLDPDIVKIVFGMDQEAIYLSRHPIPYYHKAPVEEWLLRQPYYKHIGLYGFRRDILLEVTGINESNLEKSEDITALRWIENEYHVRVQLTDLDSIEINTPDDLERLLN